MNEVNNQIKIYISVSQECYIKLNTIYPSLDLYKNVLSIKTQFI